MKRRIGEICLGSSTGGFVLDESPSAAGKVAMKERFGELSWPLSAAEFESANFFIRLER